MSTIRIQDAIRLRVSAYQSSRNHPISVQSPFDGHLIGSHPARRGNRLVRILSIHDPNRVMAKLHRKKDNYNNGDMYVLQEENYIKPDKKQLEAPKRDAFKIELY